MNSNSQDKNMKNDDDDDSDKRSRDNPYRPRQDKAEDMRLWGILIFGLIGATATTFAVGQLRRTVDWFYTQVDNTLQALGISDFDTSSYSDDLTTWPPCEEAWSQSSWKGSTGGSFRSSFQEEAWKRYNRRMQEEDSRTNFRETPQGTAHNPLSHHYSVLGLDRLRTKPYTDVEIKTAFRTKAKEFHPDQNQDNKELAEAKFKEVMSSYEAIKMERKNK
ncbi:hypothetical protein TEA_004138 [Camellia sinensis var. sinensis]|uniref:J domain-containing protein n=1 Tax=Camellia sinensis var. sinensis TaxID=542762 RepID=A0A4S4D6W3_CAMSN|nr:hypothetical protein TEA_004138 [Camellia sinensis var. sinensis]